MNFVDSKLLENFIGRLSISRNARFFLFVLNNQLSVTVFHGLLIHCGISNKNVSICIKDNVEMGVNITEELVVAITKGELEHVHSFISDGGNVNAKMEKDQNSLLHYVSSPEVTRALFLHGADVNAANIYGETPLYSAIARKIGLSVVHSLIKYGANVNIRNHFGQTPLHSAIADTGGLTVVRELLKNGANVNATDSKGNTVLFLAVKYYRNLEIIKELLEFDADINIRSSSLNRFFTPIDVAVHEGDLSCAELLIKITVLRNYHKVYHKINELESYVKFTNNAKLSCFMDYCICEIMSMKAEKINSYHSLYNFVVEERAIMRPLYSCDQILKQKILTSYYIYYDIILSHIKLCLQRGDLLAKLKDSHVCFNLDAVGKHVLGKKVILNGDCLFKIGEFLSNGDILNFLLVIDKNIDESLFCLDRYF